MNPDVAPLLAALSSPAAYSHPATDVELLETHISWVLLAGQFAYKIKRPVKLPFLDFSTLKKRHFFCEEELRLNQRLAKELYLAVVPITGTPAAPRVNGGGEPIEWAVQMRRFPQDAILSRLLERGALRPEHIDQLARTAAEFHQRIASAAPKESPWGTWDNVRQPILENFDELLAAAPAGSPLQDRIKTLREWSAARLDELRETISARRRDGWVRECHGDLHLGNIVLLPGSTIVLFDGIEFSENLRWIDVQNEIAFPVMDLQERGRPQFAWRFLNGYLEATGDYAGLTVLPLYLSYRALVRAKVDWIRGHERGVGGADREKLQAEFARYLSLAEAYARPARPRLFLTHGVSGSGKSFYAGRVAEGIGLVHLRSDVERKRLRGDSSDPAVLYSAATNAATYHRLVELAGAVLAAGFSVIVDATFLARAHRGQFRELANSAGVACTLLDFQASPETLRERIRQRQASGRDPSDADWEVLSQQLASRDPLMADEFDHVVGVNTEDAEALSDLIGALQSEPP